MDKTQKALAYFQKGFACSQAVFAVFARELGMDETMALRIACGLGAGMARTCQTCGAVSGAYLVLGLKYGRDKLEDMAARDRTYDMMQEFNRMFTARHGSVNCRELIGYNLGNPQEYQQVVEENLFRERCEAYVRTAAEWLETVAAV